MPKYQAHLSLRSPQANQLQTPVIAHQRQPWKEYDRERLREVYCGSKAALNQFMRSYADRNAETSRTMVLVAPRWVKTDLGGPNAPLTIDESIPNLVSVLHKKQGSRGLEYLDYLRRGALLAAKARICVLCGIHFKPLLSRISRWHMFKSLYSSSAALYSGTGEAAFMTRAGAWRIARNGLTMRPLIQPDLNDQFHQPRTARFGG